MIRDELGAIAAGMTERGWFVFPVAGKEPLVSSGFHSAVGTPDEAREMFAKRSKATGIGIDCGRSGLLIVDLDGPAGQDSWTRLLLEHGIVSTLCASTGRYDGGKHLYFRSTDVRARNTTGVLGISVDTRGRGGYVVAPPSLHSSGRHYRWINQHPITDAPEWILVALTPPPPPPVGERRTLPSGERITPYGRAALSGLADHMLNAAEGTRNETLLKVARRAGRLEAAGELDQDIAEDVLTRAAAMTGLPGDEIATTFSNGFKFGQQYPIQRAPR